jgi:hypothetical protein
MPAAQEKHSKPAPLKLVAPPKPFQRPTGTTASNSIASAIWASLTVLGQLISSVPGIVLIAHPPAQIGAESAKLELAIVEQRIGRAPKFLDFRSGVHFVPPPKCAMRALSGLLAASLQKNRKG